MRQLKIATQITNRDSQAVEKYLQEISKISMITPEEETTLAQRIKMFHRNPVDSQRALDKLGILWILSAPWISWYRPIFDLLSLLPSNTSTRVFRSAT